jgi:hypothetical protein
VDDLWKNLYRPWLSRLQSVVAIRLVLFSLLYIDPASQYDPILFDLLGTLSWKEYNQTTPPQASAVPDLIDDPYLLQYRPGGQQDHAAMFFFTCTYIRYACPAAPLPTHESNIALCLCLPAFQLCMHESTNVNNCCFSLSKANIPSSPDALGKVVVAPALPPRGAIINGSSL